MSACGWETPRHTAIVGGWRQPPPGSRARSARTVAPSANPLAESANPLAESANPLAESANPLADVERFIGARNVTGWKQPPMNRVVEQARSGEAAGSFCEGDGYGDLGTPGKRRKVSMSARRRRPGRGGRRVGGSRRRCVVVRRGRWASEVFAFGKQVVMGRPREVERGPTAGRRFALRSGGR
jgi:hypothetical protein